MNVNYNYLLNIKFHKFYLIIILFFLIFTSIIWFNKKTYDIYNSYFIYDNNSIIINAEIINSDAVEKGEFVKIDNKQYKYKIKNKNLILDNNMNYYEYELNINNLKYQYNEIKEITFYYNKERVIKKILKIII